MIEQAHQQYPELSVERLCELFSGSRSWYDERSGQPESDAEDIALRDQIEWIILECCGYGYRRVTHVLKRQGWKINHKRVLRFMRRGVVAMPLEEGLCGHDDQLATWLCGLSKSAG